MLRQKEWMRFVAKRTSFRCFALLRPLLDGRAKGLRRSSCDCPKCSHPLIEEEYEGAAVRRCVFCEGVLLEKDKIPRIIIRKDKGFNERVKKLAEASREGGLKF